MKCESCAKLHAEVANVQGNYGFVGGNGSPNAKVMIIGDAPGADDVVKQRALSGSSGAGYLLRKDILINELSVNPETCYITNAIKCRPLNNREPKSNEIELCRENLIAEIKSVKPKVIIVLGNTALKAVTGLTGITRLVGKELYSAEFKCYVIPALHPAAILREHRGGEKIDALNSTVQSFRQAFALVDKPRKGAKIISRFVGDSASVTKLFSALSKAASFVVDIETTGLNYHTDVIRGIAFAVSGSEGWFVPENVVTAHKAKFTQLFAKKSKNVIMHNSAFDGRFLKREGMPVCGTWVDTVLLAHLVDENEPHDLGYLAYKHTIHGGYKQQFVKYDVADVSEQYATMEIKKLAEYAGMDAAITFSIAETLLAEVAKIKCTQLYFKVIEPSRKILNDMSDRGLPVDEAYLEKVGQALAVNMDYVNAILCEMASKRGIDDLNVDSPKQVGNMIYDVLCLPCHKLTDSGANSTDAEALEKVAKAHPFPALLLEYRKMQKLYSTYVEGTRKRLVNGKLHTEFLSHGTVTGRLSSRDHNLQNIPRDGDIRKIISAPKGHELIEVDGSQIEVRMLAEYTQEPFLIEAFNRGEDIHGAVTAEILGTKDYTKEQRSCFKQVVFGISYGMEAGALAAKLTEITGRKYDESEAESYRQKFFARMENVPKWMSSTLVKARAQGYVVDLFGKRRRLPGLNSASEWRRGDADRQAINSIIQGSASYLTNAMMVRIEQRLRKEKLQTQLLLTVHDSIVAMSPKKEVSKVRKLMVAEFERTFTWAGKSLSVPIKADCESSQAWGATKESGGVVFADMQKVVKDILTKFKIKKEIKNERKTKAR